MTEEQRSSNPLVVRLAQALHLAMKHYRHDRECGSSYYGSDGSRGCGCGKTQDIFTIQALFTDDEWKEVHAGRTPRASEPPKACTHPFASLGIDGDGVMWCTNCFVKPLVILVPFGDAVTKPASQPNICYCGEYGGGRHTKSARCRPVETSECSHMYVAVAGTPIGQAKCMKCGALEQPESERGSQ